MSPLELHDPKLPPSWRHVWLAVYRAASDVAGKFAFFVVTIVAARRLGQEGFGIFSLGATVGWIAAVASDFGIQLHAARAVAQQPQDAARILRSWLRVRLVTASVAMAVLLAGVAVVGVPAGEATAIVVLAMVYLASGLLEFLFHICRGLGRTDIESTLTLCQRAATLAFGLAVLWWQPDVRLLAVALLVPMAATLVYAAPLVSTLARRQALASGTADRTHRSREATGVFAIGAGIVLSALYFRIDVFLIEMWRGTTAVALYSAVFRLVEALRLLPAAVLAVALPAMFMASSRRLSRRLAAWLTAGGAIVAAAAAAGADWIVWTLYGDSFLEAVPALRILMLAFPLMCLNYVWTQQLIGWHRHGIWAASCAAALAVNVAMNAQLVPRLGIAGAAWATVWTEAFMTLACGTALALTAAPPADVRVVQSAVL